MLEAGPPLTPVLLAALVMIWAAAFPAGMVFGRPNADRSRRLARPARLVMIAAVLACGGLWWLAAARGTTAGGFGTLIVLGLLAGALGDLILGDLFRLRYPEVLAMGAFGLGHGLYIAAVLVLRARLALPDMRPLLVAAGLGIAAAGALWSIFVRRPGGSRLINSASLAYALLLTLAAALAAGLAAEASRMLILAAGLTLFLISDLLLAQVLVRGRGFPSIRDVVWLIYSTAQMLIAFSVGVAATLAG